MTTINLATAYARFRQDLILPQGKPAPALAAMREARESFARHRDRKAHYEDTAAIRDAARAELEQAGPEDVATAQERAARAEDAHNAARRALCASRAHLTPRGPSYGAGTWQGGQGEPTAAPFHGVPLALRRSPNDWSHGYARAMSGRDRGNLFFVNGAYGDGALRQVWEADDVARLDHNGWYDNSHGESFKDGSGLVVGMVARLRNRRNSKGKRVAVFVPGYRYGGSDDNGATYDMAQQFTVELCPDHDESDLEDVRRDAALASDGMAEVAAEAERDYKDAWEAGQLYAALRADRAELSRDVRELVAELRAARRADPVRPRTVAELESSLRAVWAERETALEEMATLADGYAGNSTFAETAKEG